jgi:hypothetical protein
MGSNKMRTPVALLIFNRPEVTERVFQEIRRARPSKLFVIADGPRAGRVGEKEKCLATRAIIDRVDWSCEVLKNYSDVNLGVGDRPASGIRWVFEHVEEAIILEDDCLPHPTFFHYCDDLLEKYRNDTRIMHISGNNIDFGAQKRQFSYFYSCYCYSWGWATWRRAFQYYEPELKLWPMLRNTSWLLDILGDPRIVAFWSEKFDMNYKLGIRVVGWDWPWLFACWANHGLSIMPSVNLVSNIGFGEDATHTKKPDRRFNFPTAEMNFPLNHPLYMIRDTEAEVSVIEGLGLSLEPSDLYHRLRRKTLATLPAPARKFISSVKSKFASG